jgi:SAM-dependent methyltransferase
MSDRSRLVLLSFLMLFVELALIRWIGSNVVYLSYFSNFVLMGSFLGIGIGFLCAKSRFNAFEWAAILLAFLIGFVLVFPITIDRSGSQLIYFAQGRTSGLPPWVVLPAIFVAVAAVMACIAQRVARTFVRFEPLQAYRLDILGSLGGIAMFTLLSFLGAPPIAWGAIICVTLLALYRRPWRLLSVAACVGIIVMLGKESLDPRFSWSPYYRIGVFPYPHHSDWFDIEVNGIPHQVIIPASDAKGSLYGIPYQRIRSNPLNDVLIVGAGNGIDAAIALRAGARHVDAVEIDPRIYQIGRQLNPDRPYEDPRVTVHIDDGRAFLQRTRNQYDLILFALPDSLTVVSGQASLRLESYLFTIEAMRAARAHLRPDGAFAMYNYYREGWLLDRLANTLAVVYGNAPCVDTIAEGFHPAVLTVGVLSGHVACAAVWQPGAHGIPAPADDDHPFPYLRNSAIPAFYLATLGLILLVSLLAVRLAAGPFGQMGEYLDLFFMGAAFLLLETKNVVQFALLFGATWFVNALVFFGILLAVFAAVEVARRCRLPSRNVLYVTLFATIALAWAIEPEKLLALSFPFRLTSAIAVAFGPVFLANLIFAQRFKDVSSSTIAFATNLLGAMAGGITEYASLMIGYRNLLLVVAAFYAFALLFEARSQAVLESEPERARATP